MTIEKDSWLRISLVSFMSAEIVWSQWFWNFMYWPHWLTDGHMGWWRYRNPHQLLLRNESSRLDLSDFYLKLLKLKAFTTIEYPFSFFIVSHRQDKREMYYLMSIYFLHKLSFLILSHYFYVNPFSQKTIAGVCSRWMMMTVEW